MSYSGSLTMSPMRVTEPEYLDLTTTPSEVHHHHYHRRRHHRHRHRRHRHRSVGHRLRRSLSTGFLGRVVYGDRLYSHRHYRRHYYRRPVTYTEAYQYGPYNRYTSNYRPYTVPYHAYPRMVY